MDPILLVVLQISHNKTGILYFVKTLQFSTSGEAKYKFTAHNQTQLKP